MRFWGFLKNSTVTYSVGGLILSNSGAITANYWLSEIYDEDVASAHRNADLHLHDLSMLTGYCAGWSLRQLIEEGLGGVTGKISSAPAKSPVAAFLRKAGMSIATGQPRMQGLVGHCRQRLASHFACSAE